MFIQSPHCIQILTHKHKVFMVNPNGAGAYCASTFFCLLYPFEIKNAGGPKFIEFYYILLVAE